MPTLRGQTLTLICSRHGEQIVDAMQRDRITLMCDCTWEFDGFPGGMHPIEVDTRRNSEDDYRPVPPSRLR